MKTIQTETHLLLVDGTNYDELNDWVTNGKDIAQINALTINDPNKYLCSKIIAASPKLGELPEFETLPLTFKKVKLIEDDVKKLADNFFEKVAKGNKNENELRGFPETFKAFYIQGYKQAKSETGFSLENIELYTQWCSDKGYSYNASFGWEHPNGHRPNNSELVREYVKFLI